MSTSTRYPHVFSPITIGPVEVKNRFYLPPHGLHVMTTAGPHGSLVPSADWAHYLAERAKGGVGLIFFPMTTMPRIRGASPVFEESIPSFRAVADIVHESGAKIMAQIHGREGGGSWEPMGGMIPLINPSDEQEFVKHVTFREISVRQIREWIGIHGRVARHITEAGYDGIEVHVTHGSLMEQFLSPYFNKRRDQYGGAVENRMRPLLDALVEIRNNISTKMAVGIRLNCNEFLSGGLTQDDTRDILERLVATKLLDFADIDIAVEPQQVHLMTATQFMDPLHIIGFSGAFGQPFKGRIVLMSPGGRVTTVEQAERLIAAGQTDMVGAARGLLAEPELLKNALEGHEERSRTCIACNFCGQATRPGRIGWGCVVNPATGREGRWGVSTFTPATKPAKVVVVGAGPAGLEAARVSAKLGHTVVVLERRAKIGGQLNLWADLPGRDVLRTTIDWYGRQLAELGVTVRTGTDATAATVLAEKPDAVMIASGARYVASGESGFMPAPIPGHDRDFVYTPEQILEEGRRPTGRVLILDEERTHTGVGVAELLAAGGAQVEIVTRDLTLIGEMLTTTHEYGFIIPKLLGLGVKITIATYLKEIGEHEAHVFHIFTNEEQVRKVDAVVMATMRRSDSKLPDALEGKVAQLYVIGDALAARRFFDATYEGQRFARLLGKEGAPRDMDEAMGLFAPQAPDVLPRPASVLLEKRAIPV